MATTVNTDISGDTASKFTFTITTNDPIVDIFLNNKDNIEYIGAIHEYLINMNDEEREKWKLYTDQQKENAMLYVKGLANMRKIHPNLYKEHSNIPNKICAYYYGKLECYLRLGRGMTFSQCNAINECYFAYHFNNIFVQRTTEL